jgi:hypothetical protein
MTETPDDVADDEPITRENVTPSEPDPNFSDRPQHKDFDLLSALVIDQDIRSGEEGFTYEAYVAQVIDPASLAYLAIQRSMMAFGVRNEADLHVLRSQVAKAASVYHDAFMMGVRYQQSTSKPLLKRNARSGDPRKNGKKH